jgi:hypothetical protein
MSSSENSSTTFYLIDTNNIYFNGTGPTGPFSAPTLTSGMTMSIAARGHYIPIPLTSKPQISNNIVLEEPENTYAVFTGLSYNGNFLNLSPLTAGETIVEYSGNTYVNNNVNSGFTVSGTVKMNFVATEDQSITNQGSQVQFWTTPNGTSNMTNVLNIDSNGITFSDGTVQSSAAASDISIGQPNGVATLDSNGDVPLSQIPPIITDQLLSLQRQVNMLSAQIAEICNLWNTDLFEPHIVPDPLS